MDITASQCIKTLNFHKLNFIAYVHHLQLPETCVCSHRLCGYIKIIMHKHTYTYITTYYNKLPSIVDHSETHKLLALLANTCPII